MSRDEFNNANLEGWFNVGRFSQISALEDGQREFLEAIIEFRIAEKYDQIPEKGYKMPDAGGTIVGNIVKLDFIPDSPTFLKDYPDGIIVAKRA